MQIFFVIACLSIVSLTLGSAIRDSKAIEDRLNLKRKFQLKTKQELEKPKPQEDEIEPIDQVSNTLLVGGLILKHCVYNRRQTTKKTVHQETILQQPQSLK